MKTIVALMSFLTLSAHAADYDCKFTIERDGAVVGVMSVGQDVGETVGRIYTLPLSKKKSLGRLVEVVEVTLDGRIYDGGESNGETGIDAEFTLVTLTSKGVLARSTTETKVSLGSISGRGPVSIDAKAANGYAVRGGCAVNE